MHADEHVLAVADVAVDEGDVLAVVVRAAVADGGEVARCQRHRRLGDPLDQLVEALAVGDQVGDRDHDEVVLVGEDAQLLAAGHAGRVLLADDLAEHAGRPQAGEDGEVHRGLGVAGPAQHAAVLGPQRHDVAGSGEVGRRRVGVRQQPDGVRAVGRRDAGADALAGVDGDRVRGAAPVLVDPEHRRQVEPVGVGLGDGHADVAGGVPDHEGDQLRRRELGGEDQVALVLAVLVVDDDDGAAVLDGGDGALDGVEAPQRAAHDRPPSRRSTYLAITSTSRLTGSPGARAPSVVSRRVVGMRLTSNQGLGVVGGADRADGERDAVDGDRALLDDVAGQLGRQADAHDLPVLAGRAGQRRADAVDVALHHVPAEPGVRGDGALEVHPGAGLGRAEAAAAEGLGHDVGAPDAVASTSMTVRHTPLTAIESPRATSSSTRWRRGSAGPRSPTAVLADDERCPPPRRSR